MNFVLFAVLLDAVAANPLLRLQQSSTVPPLPVGPPQPPPPYMVSNVNNQFGVAPDKGILNGPVTAPLNATLFNALHLNPPRWFDELEDQSIQERQASDYWLAGITHGNMPLAPSGYQFYRNVKDFGAKGDGTTDDTAAINRAASSGNRCGQPCGSTTTLGALVYFPPGTYVVSTPIIQYYYTQFVGNPSNKAVIKGSANFSGIALIDSDVYIPGGNGAEWYINQSNFYRQIRNFVLDLTGMARNNTQGDQTYVPTGIHWQVGQATSITNVDFKMAVSNAQGSATAVGLFMENGSGGFVSDLTFVGGNIGMRVGSQQFTARNLQFTSCLTAISSIWNWGWTWQNIYVLSCYVAIDCTAHGGSTNQGTGSISVIDSHFNGVPYAITVAATGGVPSIVLDNLLVENSQSIVLVSGGATILPGSTGAVTISSWAMGREYLSLTDKGVYHTGFLSPIPTKSPALLDSSGKFFTRSKPQYESQGAGSFIVVTARGISNQMTGDQSGAINSLLASNVGSTIFFPAGIYLVQSTVLIPVGSKIIGEGWSQIMGTGSFFQNQASPKVMVQVGVPGNSGIVEISDMLFTVSGPTAGCILMEWNVHESTQGSAGMWDSHFRVGGASGTNLQLSNCPTGKSTNPNCMAATMLLHITSQASGYFENVWVWTADHDLDNALNGKATEDASGVPQNVLTDISIYTGRGVLIESQGPTWLYGTASEHSQLYQYQLSNASNVFLGHMQTETPYYQPSPNALLPYVPGQFPSDPTFADCGNDACRTAWALRVLNSTNIFIYSAGFYSFFQNYALGCANGQNCQQRIIDTDYTQGFWLYNLFTKGAVELISPQGGVIPPTFFNDSNQNGFTSEVAAWLPLALTGANIGDNGNGSGPVYIDPSIWRQPSPMAACQPPCTLILPPFPLSTTTTISFPPLTTSLEVGCFTETTFSQGASVVTSSVFVSIIQTTTIVIPALTTNAIPVWNVPINKTGATIIYPTSSIRVPPFVITDDVKALSSIGGCIASGAQTRSITPPPYPYSQTTRDVALPSITATNGNANPTCTAHCGSRCDLWCLAPCLVLCPFGIGGFFPPNDPNNPNDKSSTSMCRTTLASSCKTACRASPTSTCSTTCGTTLGCDVTGTNVASTITPAPVATYPFESWPTTQDTATASAAQVVMQRLSSNGDFSTSTTPPSNPGHKWVLFQRLIVSGGAGGGSVQRYSWAGIDIGFNDTPNPCTTTRNIDSTFGPTNRPLYPTSLGTFDIAGHTGCTYTGADGNTVGRFKCSDGYTSPTCTAYTSSQQNSQIACQSDSYLPRFYCPYS